jgi:hypothetical protein
LKMTEGSYYENNTQFGEWGNEKSSTFDEDF